MSQSGCVTSKPVQNQPFRRRILAVFSIVAVGGGFWLWSTRLNDLERQLVGQWTMIDRFDDGSTVTRHWDLRGDRTAHIHNLYHWVASPGRSAREEDGHTVMTWSIRRGRLLLNPIHPFLKRLEVLLRLSYWRVRNAIQGVNTLVMDAKGSNGRLSAVQADSFTVTWWSPDQRAEYSTAVLTRVRSDQTQR